MYDIYKYIVSARLLAYGMELPVAAVSFAVWWRVWKKFAAKGQWHNKECLCMWYMYVCVCVSDDVVKLLTASTCYCLFVVAVTRKETRDWAWHSDCTQN